MDGLKIEDYNEVIVMLNDREYSALQDYCKKKELSESALLRYALRLYDAYQHGPLIENPTHPINQLRKSND